MQSRHLPEQYHSWHINGQIQFVLAPGHQPAFVERALMTAAFHLPIPMDVLEHAIGELSASRMRLALAPEHLLVLLSPWDSIQKAAISRL